MDLGRRLDILADAASCDASGASSGAGRRDSRKGGLGGTEGAGFCRAHAPQGRGIAPLKAPLTKACVSDCAPGVNRASSNIPRASRWRRSSAPP